MSSLPFELALLQQMTPSYREKVLEELRVRSSPIEALPQPCELRFLETPSSDIRDYGANYGLEVAVTPSDYVSPKGLEAATPHFFLLHLWPHLFWVVHEGAGGFCREVGFESQVKVDLTNFDAALLRPGLWTKATIESRADDSELIDGWDERSVLRMRFGRSIYIGVFTFGLLDEWTAAARQKREAS